MNLKNVFLLLMFFIIIVLPVNAQTFCADAAASGKQIYFCDGFEDGDFTANPTWSDVASGSSILSNSSMDGTYALKNLGGSGLGNPYAAINTSILKSTGNHIINFSALVNPVVSATSGANQVGVYSTSTFRGTERCTISFRSSGNIGFYDGTWRVVAQYEVNNVYSVYLSINVTAETLLVWVNSSTTASQNHVNGSEINCWDDGDLIDGVHGVRAWADWTNDHGVFDNIILYNGSQPEIEADTCTYVSGDWILSDDCTIQTDTIVDALSDILVTGTVINNASITETGALTNSGTFTNSGEGAVN